MDETEDEGICAMESINLRRDHCFCKPKPRRKRIESREG
jgi:hypothetical protein